MQIQHVDILVSSHSQPGEGEYAAPVGQTVEHSVPIKGSSEVWDTWLTPLGKLADLAGFQSLAVSPVPEDASTVKLEVEAIEPDKRIALRLFVLGQ